MNIDDLMRGSIDLHVHHAPGIMSYRMDALDTARQACQLGMRAIVIKNQFYPTAPLAAMVGRLVPELKVFGGVSLDYEAGGLNSYALEASAKLGARIVWMPCHSSRNSIVNFTKISGVPLEGNGLSLLNSEHKLVPEMNKIFSLVKKYDIILASGHISPEETFALVEGALAAGISKIIVTHALPHSFEKTLTLEEQSKLGQMGAFVEYVYVGFLPNEFRDDPQRLVKAIRGVGAERCIISTDLGQYNNPSPAEGMRMFIALLLKNGMTEYEIELMAKVNPAKLLGLD